MKVRESRRYQLGDVLRMSGGIAIDDKPAVRIAQQRKLFEPESLANGVKVCDRASIDLRRAGLHVLGSTCAALVI